MPTFREVNTGQVVTVDEARAAWFRERARWQPVGNEKPETADVAAPAATPAPAGPLADDTTTNADAPAMPDADADRAEWVAYALANGKTEADVKGTRTTTIKGWFA